MAWAARDVRYKAFISYSHRDAAFGRRLHRRLETFALPRRLVGRTTAMGAAPARLSPVFRDRDELSAAHDLTAEVRAALAASGALIVVCSPAAAASPWVDREIEAFRALHPDRPILAALIAGEPAEAFPEALRRAGPGGLVVEPLAADFRPGGDGARLALLKLVAGVLGLGLDELVQRDAQRRLQAVTAVTVGALVLALSMGGLAAFALAQRAEAERQRGEAEGMVEFMLTDLRTKLKGVGRLDIMGAVNQRAYRHYAGQDLARLPADSLERRARILHAMGEDDETRGDHEAALAKFREARRTTAQLLAADPDNPERIFDQAQSEYWLGYVDYQRGRDAAARPAFEEYKRLADRMVALQPGNPKYQREAGYAEGNLCSIALSPPKRPREALRACSAALQHMASAARGFGMSLEVVGDLVNRHAWLSDAYHANGMRAEAVAHRLEEESLLSGLIKADPKNMDLKDTWIALQRALARLEAEGGQSAAARARLQAAAGELDSMMRFDPTNQEWARQRSRVNVQLSQL